jgi:hypothetical protein
VVERRLWAHLSAYQAKARFPGDKLAIAGDRTMAAVSPVAKRPPNGSMHASGGEMYGHSNSSHRRPVQSERSGIEFGELSRDR